MTKIFEETPCQLYIPCLMHNFGREWAHSSHTHTPTTQVTAPGLSMTRTLHLLELCCRTTESGHWRHSRCRYQRLQIYSARLDPHRALFHSTTQYWDTNRCPSHCNQLRRGMPLTRSWFMPALNTQRFATVLTHQLTCFSHAEYHFCVTVYQSDDV